MKTDRISGYDASKGVLILFVMLGHVLLGTINENYVRTFIYSFHMPLFIGISGNLTKISRLAQASTRKIILKYLFRVIIPWAIAVIFYESAVYSKPFFEWTFTHYLKAFLLPYYHLWFIPAYLSWLIVSLVFERIRLGYVWRLIICGVTSVSFYVLKSFPDFYKGIPYLENTIQMVLHTFRPYFLIFFVFGTYLKGTQGVLKLAKSGLITILFLIGYVLSSIANIEAGKIFNFYVFNIFLLNTTYLLIVKKKLPETKIILWIGQYSLAIYLWHVFPLIFLKEIIFTKIDTNTYYLIATFLEILILVLIKQLSRISIINHYFFGMNKVNY